MDKVKLTTEEFTFSDYTIFKTKMLNWANRFNIFCFLDTNGYLDQQGSFDCILAAGSRRSLQMEPGMAFLQLKNFYDEDPGWLFGHLGYDLKNEVESLHDSKKDVVGFGLGFFFEPKFLLQVSNNSVSISAREATGLQRIFDDILQTDIQSGYKPGVTQTTIHSSLDKKGYLSIIEKLKEHIHRGDCYEINFCRQFFAEDISIEPVLLYTELVKHSPNPFGALYKLNDKFCLCASPERFLKKVQQDIISQPIKGTSRRSLLDQGQDEKNKQYLLDSPKERSENVMVVDLVRNDLSRICEEGSVYVQELFGVYSFPQVHQMISTIRGTVKEGLPFTDALKATFPMGSMTGAPKKRVMELIDTYETTARGLFSGSIGYITPNGDFDFNVVIRSIFFNASKKYLSFSAGSGITFYSDPVEEYRECMLKAQAIREVLQKVAHISLEE